MALRNALISLEEKGGGPIKLDTTQKAAIEYLARHATVETDLIVYGAHRASSTTTTLAVCDADGARLKFLMARLA